MPQKPAARRLGYLDRIRRRARTRWRAGSPRSALVVGSKDSIRRCSPWWEGPQFFGSQRASAGLDLEHLAVKIMSTNVQTGGQSLLVRLSPSYRGELQGTIDAQLEAYVLSGSLSVGEQHLRAGHFAHQPAGSSTGVIASEEGALVILKSSADLDIAVGS